MHTWQYDVPDRSPEPEGCDTKEVYAFYGLALYASQVLERGLMTLATFLNTALHESPTQTLYDELYEGISMRTLGHVLRQVRDLTTLPEEVEEHLTRSLTVRNELSHHFFWNNAGDFFTLGGRQAMIRELREAISLFEDADRRVTELSLQIGARFGITNEVIAKEFAALLQEAKDRHGDA